MLETEKKFADSKSLLALKTLQLAEKYALVVMNYQGIR